MQLVGLNMINLVLLLHVCKNITGGQGAGIFNYSIGNYDIKRKHMDLDVGHFVQGMNMMLRTAGLH